MVNQTLTGFEEVIKCVIVGDSGVGKTCLTCSYACNSKYDLRKLVRTHQATVWATDHYQNDKDVLERSWCDLDGCQVSIRLWDTFGYHDKDRRFAYRGADVIVICFSVLAPRSLRNVRAIWQPEARRLSPNTPIVLCGTQADLRYLCLDEKYINMEKGLLYRNISPNDMIPPSVGREVARDIGAPYYETSVLTQYGVHDVFLNAARIALLERRKIKFWNTQLRKIQRPLIQPPFSCPMPTAPKMWALPAQPGSDVSALVNNRSECDVTFLVGASTVEAHRICLAVASSFFEDLFSLESLAKLPPTRRRRKRRSENSNCYEDEQLRSKFPTRFFPSSSVSSDQDHLLPDSDLDSLSTTDTEYESTSIGAGISSSLPSGSCDSSGGYLSFPSAASRRMFQRQFPLIIPYDHPAVETIEIRYEEEDSDSIHKTLKSYIRMNDQISAKAFRVVVEYMYTGSIRTLDVQIEEIRSTAELLQLTDLIIVIDNMNSRQDYLNIEMDKQFHMKRIVKMRELALDRGFLSDISFEVDNGIVSAHKALLIGRCEMMYAMFNNDFIESASDVVPFPGISAETFCALQEFLYTGETPRQLCSNPTPGLDHSSAGVDCVALIELANRLCLPRLLSMVEVAVVEQFTSGYDSRQEMLHDVLSLMEPARFYNADQLLRFCIYTLSTNYADVITHHHKLFSLLPQETREHVEMHRWPPAWYVKEKEQYDRLQQAHSGSGSRRQTAVIVQDYNTRCGCLCFSRRGRHRLRDPVEMPI